MTRLGRGSCVKVFASSHVEVNRSTPLLSKRVSEWICHLQTIKIEEGGKSLMMCSLIAIVLADYNAAFLCRYKNKFTIFYFFFHFYSKKCIYAYICEHTLHRSFLFCTAVVYIRYHKYISMNNVKIRKVSKSTCWRKILKNKYNINQINSSTKI